jgi:Mg/Co/Ni transporter MgtE
MPMQEDRPPRKVREPRLFGLIPRERAYLILMGTCLLLIVLAWTLIWRYSTVAAVAMSAVALVIPPVAVIIGNAGPVNRQ